MIDLIAKHDKLLIVDFLRVLTESAIGDILSPTIEFNLALVLIISDVLRLAESPRLATRNFDWLLVVLIEPDKFVGCGSLGFILLCSLLPQFGFSRVRNLMVTPFPEVVVLINAKCSHSFRCHNLHVGSFREDRGSPLRSS